LVGSELTRLHPGRVVVVGGTASVTDAVANAAGSVASASVTRIAGNDRYATAAALSAATFPTATNIAYLAAGGSFADALAAGAVAAHHGSPLLLDNPVAPPTDVLDELHRLAPSSLIAVGGTAALSAANLDALTGVVTSDTTTAPAGGSSGGGGGAPAP